MTPHSLLRVGRLGRSGTAAVEFALVLLPFLTLIFAIFQFGVYLWVKHSMEAACETAIEYVYANSSTATPAAIQAAIPGKVQTTLNTIAANLGGNVTVTPVLSTVNGVNFITITATTRFAWMGLMKLGVSTLTAQVRVPVE